MVTVNYGERKRQEGPGGKTKEGKRTESRGKEEIARERKESDLEERTRLLYFSDQL